MKRIVVWIIVVIIGLGVAAYILFGRDKNSDISEGQGSIAGEEIVLPEPGRESEISVEEALWERRSVREYKDEPLTIADVSQMVWAAQGVTRKGGKRTAPSAGAKYPTELYVVSGDVEGLVAGVYKYVPDDHKLLRVAEGDKREELSEVALGQESVRNGKAVLVITSVFERVTEKYGDKGVQYSYMEAGHVAQNVYLQAVALDLGTVSVGGFDVEGVIRVVGLADDERPMYLMPMGKV
jgi:SagB-type dehydrogenase family enzyme